MCPGFTCFKFKFTSPFVSSLRCLLEPLVAQSATAVWGDGCRGAWRDLPRWDGCLLVLVEHCCCVGGLHPLQPPDITGTVGEPVAHSAEGQTTDISHQPNSFYNHTNNLVFYFTFMNFHWSLLAVGRGLRHGERITCSPLVSKHNDPIGPHRTSPSEFRSQCCNNRHHFCPCVSPISI